MSTTTKIDTGGAIAPWPQTCEGGDQGMTLLDYFAGLAMWAKLANREIYRATGAIARDRGIEITECLAAGSYEIAQAMIAEKRRLEAE